MWTLSALPSVVYVPGIYTHWTGMERWFQSAAAVYSLAAGTSKTVHACRQPLMQSPANALASFKSLHKDLRSDEGIDGKRKSDAIIMPEVIVELPQILSLQA